MTQGVGKRISRFFGSAVFATCLIVFIGAWVAVASLVPQGDASNLSVAQWAGAHPVLEPVVRTLGLHQAFSSPIFYLAAILLAVSAALCSWERTKIALKRTRALRDAASCTSESLVAAHDIEVACSADLTASEALAATTEALQSAGLNPRERKGVVSAVAGPWTPWGSPVFHWALVSLLAVVLLGGLYRASGYMGLVVGETKPDVRASYGELVAGPLRDWNRVHRSLRMVAFDPSYVLDGLDRGPTPTVSVLDGNGRVLKTQPIYPNNTLRTGSLTIHPGERGLFARITILNAIGLPVAQVNQLVDFSDKAPDGTVSAGSFLTVSDDKTQRAQVKVTIPLDRDQGQFVLAPPAKPQARVVIATLDGREQMNQVLAPGGELNLPFGRTIRLDGIGWYARLYVVDDWTIPLLYAAIAVAICGLGATLVARQHLVLATVVEGADGPVVLVRMRLWRNATVDSSELRTLLADALGVPEKGSAE